MAALGRCKLSERCEQVRFRSTGNCDRVFSNSGIPDVVNGNGTQVTLKGNHIFDLIMPP